MQQVKLVHQYFDVMLTEGNTSIIGEVLTQSVSHKDMVRNVGRVGLQVRACMGEAGAGAACCMTR
jgi:homoserine kinase